MLLKTVSKIESFKSKLKLQAALELPQSILELAGESSTVRTNGS